MMNDPATLATLAASGLAAVAIVSLSALKGWNGWLDLQRTALGGGGRGPTLADTSPAARIELADLRERVRKLEAIAAGVDL